MIRKVLLILLTALIIAILVLLYKGFAIKKKSNDFILIGFSGFKKYWSHSRKPKFYWKELKMSLLDGKDYAYVLENGGGRKKLIYVDASDSIHSSELTDSIIEIHPKHVANSFKVTIDSVYHTPAHTYNTSDPIFVISDIEGNYKSFYNLLTANGIMDSNAQWVFGKGHLVILGDYFDRGDDVNPILWLCYKLSRESKEAEGAVHMILGNHEIMNFKGNIKYVRGKYKAIAQKLEIDYKDLYGPKSEIGMWLRKQNSVEVINDILFCHGGISPELLDATTSLDEINSSIRDLIDKSVTSEKNKIFVGSNGPLWYRGYFKEDSGITQSSINSICAQFNVNRIIVGHTPVPQVTALFDGKVVAVDVPRTSPSTHSTLLIKNQKFYTSNEAGENTPL